MVYFTYHFYVEVQLLAFRADSVAQRSDSIPTFGDFMSVETVDNLFFFSMELNVRVR